MKKEGDIELKGFRSPIVRIGAIIIVAIIFGVALFSNPFSAKAGDLDLDQYCAGYPRGNQDIVERGRICESRMGAKVQTIQATPSEMFGNSGLVGKILMSFTVILDKTILYPAYWFSCHMVGGMLGSNYHPSIQAQYSSLKGTCRIVDSDQYKLGGPSVVTETLAGKTISIGNIRTKYFSQGESSNWVAKTYKTFRGLFNLILVILLIALALANILHIQVDTYAIKKMLPTVLVVAVLGNLALPIIALFSRIVDSLQNTMMFSPINVANVYNLVLGGAWGTTSLIEAATGLGTSIIGLGAATAITGGGLFFMAFCVGMLLLFVPAVAVLLLMLVLAFRPYIVFLMAAVSPLAIACAILPQTQQWFKKWLGILVPWLFLPILVNAIFYLASLIPQATPSAGGVSWNSGGLVTALVGFVLPVLIKTGMVILAIRLPFMIEKDISGLIHRGGVELGKLGWTGLGAATTSISGKYRKQGLKAMAIGQKNRIMKGLNPVLANSAKEVTDVKEKHEKTLRQERTDSTLRTQKEMNDINKATQASGGPEKYKDLDAFLLDTKATKGLLSEDDKENQRLIDLIGKNDTEIKDQAIKEIGDGITAANVYKEEGTSEEEEQKKAEDAKKRQEKRKAAGQEEDENDKGIIEKWDEYQKARGTLTSYAVSSEEIEEAGKAAEKEYQESARGKTYEFIRGWNPYGAWAAYKMRQETAASERETRASKYSNVSRFLRGDVGEMNHSKTIAADDISAIDNIEGLKEYTKLTRERMTKQVMKNMGVTASVAAQMLEHEFNRLRVRVSSSKDYLDNHLWHGVLVRDIADTKTADYKMKNLARREVRYTKNAAEMREADERSRQVMRNYWVGGAAGTGGGAAMPAGPIRPNQRADQLSYFERRMLMGLKEQTAAVRQLAGRGQVPEAITLAGNIDASDFNLPDLESHCTRMVDLMNQRGGQPLADELHGADIDVTAVHQKIDAATNINAELKPELHEIAGQYQLGRIMTHAKLAQSAETQKPKAGAGMTAGVPPANVGAAREEAQKLMTGEKPEF